MEGQSSSPKSSSSPKPSSSPPPPKIQKVDDARLLDQKIQKPTQERTDSDIRIDQLCKELNKEKADREKAQTELDQMMKITSNRFNKLLEELKTKNELIGQLEKEREAEMKRIQSQLDEKTAEVDEMKRKEEKMETELKDLNLKHQHQNDISLHLIQTNMEVTILHWLILGPTDRGFKMLVSSKAEISQYIEKIIQLFIQN